MIGTITRKISHILNEKRAAWFWWVFFCYTALVSLFVQLVLLPYLFPQWHAGHGLLISYYDAQSTHNWALELAENIHTHGWSAWELHYRGQGNAGIAAALYAVTLPEPWVLIPLHAVLHATATLFLLLIIDSFLSNRYLAILAVLPFLLYPSAMTWYSQPLKDGYSIAGVIMIVYGWILIAERERWKKQWVNSLMSILLIFCGSFLAWVARPYVVSIMQNLSVLVAVLLTVAAVWRGTYRFSRAFAHTMFGIVTVWSAFFVMSLLEPVGFEQLLESGAPVNQVEVEQGNDSLTSQAAIEQNDKGQLPVATKLVPHRNPIELMFRKADDKLLMLAHVRDGYRLCCPGAASNIDTEVVLQSSREVLTYLPRAAQIAFLAPFPSHWLGKGSLEANTLMRRITAFEMLGVYFALFFLPYTIWHWRKRIELWIVLICCIPPLLIQGIVFANVGTIYRMRYGFLMTLVAVGLAGFISAYQKVQGKCFGRNKDNS